MILRNRVLRLRIVKKWEVPSRKWLDFSSAQESLIQVSKRSDMCNADITGLAQI